MSKFLFVVLIGPFGFLFIPRKKEKKRLKENTQKSDKVSQKQSEDHQKHTLNVQLKVNDKTSEYEFDVNSAENIEININSDDLETEKKNVKASKLENKINN